MSQPVPMPSAPSPDVGPVPMPSRESDKDPVPMPQGCYCGQSWPSVWDNRNIWHTATDKANAYKAMVKAMLRGLAV